MALVNATDALHTDSPATTPVSIGAGGTANLLALDTADSSGINATSEHNGIQLSADSANTTPVYVLLGAGTASATNWHFVLAAGASWSGDIGGCLYRGRVSGFSAAAAKVGVAVV